MEGVGVSTRPILLRVRVRETKRTQVSPYFLAMAALSSTAFAVAAVPCSCPWTLVVSHTAPVPSLGMPSLNLCTAAHTSSSFCGRSECS